MIPQTVRAQIDAILDDFGSDASLLPAAAGAGKLYEAWVLGRVLKGLRDDEGFELRLVRGSKLVLKSSGGPINTAYPHFEGVSGSRRISIWTDVEFSTLSFAARGGMPPLGASDRHELDIVVVEQGLVGYPAYREVLWGIECKHTTFEKSMARAALGVRRELSLLTRSAPTFFSSWPVIAVPAEPASVVSVYSIDPTVLKYRDAGSVFGIEFVHEPLRL